MVVILTPILQSDVLTCEQTRCEFVLLTFNEGNEVSLPVICQRPQSLKHTSLKIHMEHVLMEVWNIIFLSKWVICRFHVNLPGCTFFNSSGNLN